MMRSRGAAGTTVRWMSTRGAIDTKEYPYSRPNTIINVCEQGQMVMIERFGKLHRVQKEGLFFAIPFVDKLQYSVDMREIVLDIEPQSGYTKDNVAAAAAGTIYVQVTDPVKACYNVRRILFAIENLAKSSMRTAIGRVDLDTLNHDRNSLNKVVQDAMGNTSEKWGAEVVRFELQKVMYDAVVQKAMDKQAVAERTRREEVLAAEADKTAAQRRSEGEMQAIINIAEANKKKVLLAAEAKEESIRIIAQALKEENGDTAMNLELANRYVELMTDTVEKANMNTMFLPDNVMDVGKVLGGSMGILDGIKAGSIPKKQ